MANSGGISGDVRALVARSEAEQYAERLTKEMEAASAHRAQCVFKVRSCELNFFSPNTTYETAELDLGLAEKDLQKANRRCKMVEEEHRAFTSELALPASSPVEKTTSDPENNARFWLRLDKLKRGDRGARAAPLLKTPSPAAKAMCTRRAKAVCNSARNKTVSRRLMKAI